MNENPFSEPDDGDHTIIRPVPGGRRRPVTPAPPPRLAEPAPAPAEPLAPGGTPLAAAAAPLLQLLARLRNAAHPPDAADLRERVLWELRAFEQRARDGGVPMEQLRPAHLALCASLDDAVLNTPWGQAGAWKTRPMAASFHQDADGGQIFELLGRMRQNPAKFLPAIELIYLCLSLGFMGRYRAAPNGAAAIGRLRQELFELIQQQRPAGELAPHWRGVAAPYRPRCNRFPLWVAGALGLLAVALLFVWSSTSLNAASDDLFAGMLATAPASMPQITRVAVAQAVPPPPAPPQPGTMDRLRNAFRREIAQGQISVAGTEAVPILRIANRGLFPNGSATLQPAAKPLLERVGLALKNEPGKLQVIAYTDNQPTRTVAFPSNYALTTARAQAARAVIAAAAGDADRLSAEGRADAEPVAPNTSAEGRERNRRIDIVLIRQDA